LDEKDLGVKPGFKLLLTTREIFGTDVFTIPRDVLINFGKIDLFVI
jgi:hypothetical protein